MCSRNLRNRYIGPCGTETSTPVKWECDLTNFVIRLLLFDKYILQSHGLREIPILINTFGYDGFNMIFEAGILQIHMQIYEIGSLSHCRLKNGSRVEIPPESYAFGFIQASNSTEIIHRRMKTLHAIKELKHNEVIKLKRAIVSKFVYFPETSARTIMTQMLEDFRNNNPSVQKAVTLRLQGKSNISNILVDKIQMHIEVDSDEIVHVKSNIKDLLRTAEFNINDTIRQGLLAIGGINERLETMRAFSALTGFQENDIPVFENKLEHIINMVNPTSYEAKARRILSWSNFPDLTAALLNKSISVKKILKIRESRECEEFRNWLWSTNEIADQELHRRFTSILSQMSVHYTAEKGKNVRWIVTTGIGSIPGAGLVGTAISALDHFVLSKLLKENGVVTFLSKIYPSIFIGQ